MSTVKANTFQDASGGSTATINGMTPTADSLQGFRNRIINGDMRIDQRNAGAAVTANGSYVVDRFLVQNVTDGAFSAQQDTSAPVGFVNSIKWTTTTADGTLTTTQQASIQQRIEGTNVSDLAFGTANAKTVTVSFWVRSSLTGTFGGSLRNGASDRSYPFTYSISVADTWEQKSIAIAGDTSGTWLTTTGVGLVVTWGLGAGPDRSGTAGAWNSNNNNSATGAVSVIGTLNATFYITGVQLEVGSVATPFERRPYGAELVLCQRYYIKWTQTANSSYGIFEGWARTTIAFRATAPLAVTMRASPTSTYSNVNINDGAAAYTVSSVVDLSTATTFAVQFATTGMTAYRPGSLGSNGSAAYIAASAEL